jgi:hypothetical protein
VEVEWKLEYRFEVELQFSLEPHLNEVLWSLEGHRFELELV